MLDSLLTRPGSTPAALLDALARRLGAAGLAADVLTHAALACGVGAGALFWLDHGWLALLALIVVAGPRLAGVAAYVYAGLEIVTAAQRFRYGRRALG